MDNSLMHLNLSVHYDLARNIFHVYHVYLGFKRYTDYDPLSPGLLLF